jgi:two-component system, NtrC family, response regulator HydG
MNQADPSPPVFDSAAALPEPFRRALLEVIPCALIVLNEVRRVIFFNAAAEKLTGYVAADMLGASCETLQQTFRGPAEPDVLAVLCPFEHLTGHWQDECELRRKDGTAVTVVRRACPVTDAQGEAIGTIQALMDISAIKQARSEIVQLRDKIARLGQFGQIVGTSPPMQKLFERIALAAETTASVVITGPTGTGKELIARTLHERSDRQAGPFLAVNCGALPEGLIEAELFGYVKGAFTGASADRKGRFAQAHGGTLLLDEVGELPAPAQVKLLRALQEGEITPVGQSTPQHVDVRIIAATNRDLREMVRQGTFREDLYYRLAVMTLHAPPLRDRREDIPALASHFIAQYNGRYDRHIERCDPAALRRLESCAWPGNVRQLQHAIEHAFVVSGPDARVIGLQDLPEDILTPPTTQPDPASPAEPTPTAPPASPQDEAQQVRDALDRTGGNKTQAARLLGITRAGLYKKLKRLGLS